MEMLEKQSLRSNLDLIKVVHDNYGHISELDKLAGLFQIAEIHDNEKPYHYPRHYDFLLKVTRDTILSHYGEDKNLLLVDDVIEEIKENWGEDIEANDVELESLKKFEKEKK